jgi:hypothetical protein
MMTDETGGLAKAVTTASMALTHSLGRERPILSAILLMSVLHALYLCLCHRFVEQMSEPSPLKAATLPAVRLYPGS